jgi:NAD(P)-dependent dehydrogenase (short-subunit alcohol dehydrogenase family)
MESNNRVAIITGASSGIGSAAALSLLSQGFTVYGAARRIDRLEALASQGVKPLALDVTDAKSMQGGIANVMASSGRIDVLVNNAGYGSYGAIEDVSQEEAKRQFDVNVFGAMELTKLVLPQMRKQGSGRIINISSVGGRAVGPFGGWYHGTKFALEALSDSLRMELKPFGIDVVVVEPGGIKSEFLDIAASGLQATSGNGPYADRVKSMLASFTNPRMMSMQSPPQVIADIIARAATVKQPKTRYVAGFGARPLVTLRRLLSDRAFDSLISRVSGTPTKGS